MRFTKLACSMLLAGTALVMTSGCMRAPVVPPWGIVYTGYSAPLDIDQEESPVGMREGRSSSISILGLVAVGDASIDAAASDGGITTLHGADYEYTNILGIYQDYTTIVRGE